MKLSHLILVAAGTAVHAAYPGDIVFYWVETSATLVNGTISSGLQSPPSAWFPAIVQGAVYQAAVKSKNENLEFQQLAVSHAAHDALLWVFHGTRLYNPINAALRAVVPAIGLDPNSRKGKDAVKTGREAAAKVAKARADDKITNFVDFVFGPKEPGVYQQTPGGQPLPDTPQARFVTPFGGVGDISRFRGPPPPKTNSKEYEEEVLFLKEYGSLNSTSRSQYDTDTAYFWLESSVTGWNRFAGAVVRDAFKTKVLESAKFYAKLNYALANAGFAAWDEKYHYQAWRPITAIHHPGTWLSSGQTITDPSWTPLLRPTPSHPDYPSTHATFGAAAAAVIREAFNRGRDTLNPPATLSSTVSLDGRGTITRTYTKLSDAVVENSKSRVFGGIHFDFAGEEGNALGERVALETLKKFDAHWDKF
ncbi:hypothetical protein VTJ49DRAFT_7185 [Mycothermus thermophilus]|uniref:Phosphatidic acid phosphatase type 2/haloperoxidase domain-containing protein n=1 Tax=Humicola insolens TaxID=85995 RepID=A0ABR3VPL3_HUMIN